MSSPVPVLDRPHASRALRLLPLRLLVPEGSYSRRGPCHHLSAYW